MPRAFLAVVGWIFGVTVVAIVAPSLTIGVLACSGAAALLWACSQCRHSGPLGLLPPVNRPDGTREPARWFCSACGKVWPAGIDHDSTPIVRYTGYDPTKLPAAARRASRLEREMQTLAVRRAGPAVRSTTAARTPAAVATTAASTIVSIQDGRRLAK